MLTLLMGTEVSNSSVHRRRGNVGFRYLPTEAGIGNYAVNTLPTPVTGFGSVRGLVDRKTAVPVQGLTGKKSVQQVPLDDNDAAPDHGEGELADAERAS